MEYEICWHTVCLESSVCEFEFFLVGISSEVMPTFFKQTVLSESRISAFNHSVLATGQH